MLAPPRYQLTKAARLDGFSAIAPRAVNVAGRAVRQKKGLAEPVILVCGTSAHDPYRRSYGPTKAPCATVC